MFEEEKRKINYGGIGLLCIFFCVFAFQLFRLNSVSPNATITQIDIPKLSGLQQYWRDRPPSTYCLEIKSFKKLADSPNSEKYESRPFTSGGYNWTLIVYPRGNKADDAAGQVSLYVKIDNSSLLNFPKEVYAEIKFFVYNRKEDKYYIYQETEARRFFLFKPMWGVPRIRSYDDFMNQGNGWIFDGDRCLFGVDVFVAPMFDKWEAFSFSDNFHIRIHTLTLRKFSTLYERFYVSDEFSIGARNWALKLYPNGDGLGQGNSLSLYVVATTVKPKEKIYLRAKLRVLDQKQAKHVEKKVENWSDGANSWGYEQFVSFADLRDQSKGLIVNDTLKIEVEFEAFSNTKYFPELASV